MSVTIQDDMWDAAKAMKGKQGESFLLSLLRYGFEGEEPSASEACYPFFVLCKDRVDLSVKRSNTGAGRKSKPAFDSKSKRALDSESNHASDYEQGAETTEINKPDNRGEVSRGENEVRREGEEESALDSNQSERNAQISEVISHLNAVCGTNYRPNAETSRKYIGARLAEGYTVADCCRVIDLKAAQWLHDERMRTYLRPTTLFRPEKFESYLNQPSDPEAVNWDAYELAPEGVAQ